MPNPIVGSSVRLQITVTDPDTGDLTDATVELAILDPSGNQTDPVPTNPSTGIYQHFLTGDESGWFTATWTVTFGSFTTVTECQVCFTASVLV